MDPSAESLWGIPPAGGEPLCLDGLPSPWRQPSRQSMPDPRRETKAGTGLARPFSFRAPGGMGGLRSLWGFSAQAAPAPAPKPPSQARLLLHPQSPPPCTIAHEPQSHSLLFGKPNCIS